MIESKSKWVVGQIGSRRNYLVPATFNKLGRLAAFSTDFWIDGSVVRGMNRLGVRGKFMGRHNAELMQSRVKWPKMAGVLGNLRIARKKRDEGWYKDLMKLARAVSATSASLIDERRAEPTKGFWGFTLESLDAIRKSNERGIPSILEQYDPGEREDQLVKEYAECHPGWGYGVEMRPQFYFERIRKEWAEATRIVVASDWSKRCLEEQGVEGEKIDIIPLATAIPRAEKTQRTVNQGPGIKIVFVGTFNLRKGAPDFAEVARRLLHRKDIQFVVAGPIHVPDAILAELPNNIVFLGPVPRAAVPDLYRSADLLLLPAVSEGFGIVQIEAASYGVAVIATDRVGKFVTDGESGYIVNIGDYDGVVERITGLADDREKLFRMGQRAAEQSKGFSPETYAQNVEKLVASLD